jgi:hypothetical protein
MVLLEEDWEIPTKVSECGISRWRQFNKSNKLAQKKKIEKIKVDLYC